MALFLDVTTSAEFWRKIYPVDRMPKHALAFVPNECVYSAEDVKSLAPQWAVSPVFLEPIGGKLHVLVLNEKQRRSSAAHVTRTWSTRIPEGSFHALSDTVYVMSPCFMFLVASTFLSVHKLIAFGCELCGFYGFDENEERGFRTRTVPLTTVGALRRYLDGAKGCPGYRNAIRALAHVFERSASPMETFDAMALFGTYHLGGYHLGTPSMNHEVPLTPRAARIAKRSKCFLDMGFPENMLDIEHHGAHDHSRVEDKVSDRARVNALQEMGFTVIELTADQVNDLKAFEYIAQRIAKILGKRLSKQKLGATPERLAFRREVFEWNRTSGRLR